MYGSIGVTSLNSVFVKLLIKNTGKGYLFFQISHLINIWVKKKPARTGRLCKNQAEKTITKALDRDLAMYQVDLAITP